MGFKGSKKNTPYAAQTAAGDAAKKAYDAGPEKSGCICERPGRVVKVLSARSHSPVLM
jgi:small subunit ribosomal protein S11